MAFQLLNKLDKIIRFSTLITKEYVAECETVSEFLTRFYSISFTLFCKIFS